jgi:hypothetical protein
LSLPQKCDIFWGPDEQRRGAVSNELTKRFTLIVARPRAHSCIIDVEAVACGEDRISFFGRVGKRIRGQEALAPSADQWALRFPHKSGPILSCRTQRQVRQLRS